MRLHSYEQPESRPVTPLRPAPIRVHAPDHSAEVAAGRRAADAARRVIGAMVASTAPVAELEAAAAELDRLAERLAPYAVTASRYEGTQGLTIGDDPEVDEQGRAEVNAQVFEHHPYVGPSSPVAPPIVIEPADGGIDATVTYDHRHEGPPGFVHGGVIAGAFDLILAATAGTARRPAMTGTLTIRYRKPTPLHTPLRFAGRVEDVDGRKIRCTGNVTTADGTVTCEADGIFIVVADNRFRPGDAPE